jgi:transcription initiation factor IIE alpha subunit
MCGRYKMVKLPLPERYQKRYQCTACGAYLRYTEKGIVASDDNAAKAIRRGHRQAKT